MPSFKRSFYRTVALAAICLFVAIGVAKAQSSAPLVFTITGTAANYPGVSNNPSFIAPGTETLSGTIQASPNCSFGDPTYGLHISCPVTTINITDSALGVTLTVPANDASCPLPPAMNYYLSTYYLPSPAPPIPAGQWVLNCGFANIPNSAFNVSPGPAILLLMDAYLGGEILDINTTGGLSFTASTGTLYYMEYIVGTYPATTTGTYAGSYTITPVGINPEIFSLSGSLPSTGTVTGAVGGSIVANCPAAGTPCPILAINVISDTAGASTAFITGNSLALVDTPEAPPLQDLWSLSGNLTDSTGNVILTTFYQGALEGPNAGWIYDSGALTGIYNINLETTSSVSGKSLGNCMCPVGDPIDAGSGNVYEQVTDYSTAGQNPLQFIRSYNSATVPTQAVALGHNWRSNFDRYVVISASSVLAERGDGQQLTFALNSGKWQPDSDVDLALTNTGTTWALTDNNDTVETYMAPVSLVTTGPTPTTSVAYLQSIQLRNGYRQTLQYNSTGQVTAITDSYGRALQFEYSGALLKTVITPEGLPLAYDYNSSGLNPGVLDRLASVTYPTTPQGSLSYVYGADFALAGIIDENGSNYVSWGYDAAGRGSGNNLGGSVLETVTYDGDGTRVVTNAYNEQEVYKFATLQGVPKVTEIDRLANGAIPAAKRLFTYDANGYPASSTDWIGNLTTFVNNSHGQPTVINEAVGTSVARTTTITYDQTFVHLPATIATTGLTTTFTYDAQGNLVTKTLTDTTATIVPYATKGQTRIWKYTWANALLTSVTTPNGNMTAFSYDGSGALVQTTNALGQVTAITSHTPGGFPTAITDANGVATTLSYDGRQHLTSSVLHTAAGLLTTANTYDLAEDLASTTFPDGSKLTYSYDGFHRLAGVSDLFGNQIQYTHDVEGDLLNTTIPGISNPFGIPGLNLPLLSRSNTFDALFRLSQSSDGLSNVSAYTRDANGNALTVTDGDGHAAQQAFDGLNRLSRVIDALSGITKLTYDAHDRPVTVVDPNSASTTFVYDGSGDVIQRISPDTGTTKYYYDADGNLTQMIDGRGVVTNYTYDALDRVLTTTFPGDPAENIAYRYDESGHGFGVGRLTSLTDAAGTLSRTTDERGNILSEQRIHGSSTSVTGYAYDAANRVASITYPSGWTISYSRDAMGRVQGMSALLPGSTSPAPILSGVTWEPFGPPSGFTYGNGIVETRSFDSGYRMTGVTDTGANPVQSLSYFLDGATNVSAISDGVTPGNSQSFSYDALNHLTSATGAYGSLAWTYTPIGNRQTQIANGVSTSYTYASHSNQLTGIKTGAATQSVAYTGAGNIGSITPNTGAATAISYNAANRSASVTGSPVAITAMVYDALGRRFSKTSGGTTNIFSYGQSGELLEENDNGFPVDYVYLDGQPVAEIQPSRGKVYFLHDDRLGTPQVATDNSQTVVWSTTYQPFGQTTLPSGTITQNLRFPGQYADAETGWNQNWFRDYLPGFGRYAESDPIGILGGLNTYSYVNASPPISVDPMGLWQITITWGWGFAAQVTFGNNGGSGWFNGQWNYGFYAGLGAGFSSVLDPQNSGCKPTGTEWSAKVSASMLAILYNLELGAEYNFSNGDASLEAIIGTPFSGSRAALLSPGNMPSALQTSITSRLQTGDTGSGDSWFGGFGGLHRF